MAAEGEIRVGIVWDGRDVRSVEIDSTRPHVAGRVLAGQHPRAAAKTVPLLFSICRRSQAIASALACQSAQGMEPTADQLLAHARVVTMEMVEEYSWRGLIDWPHALGEPANPRALADIRHALDAGSDEIPAAARALVEQHVFGTAAERFLAQDLHRFDRWLRRGDTPAARLLVAVRRAQPSFGASEVALMPCSRRDALLRDVGAAVGHDENFARAPQWNGQPAETGALARLCQDTLVSDLVKRSGRTALARFAEGCASLQPSLPKRRSRLLAAWRSGRAAVSAGSKTRAACSSITSRWTVNASRPIASWRRPNGTSTLAARWSRTRGDARGKRI